MALRTCFSKLLIPVLLAAAQELGNNSPRVMRNRRLQQQYSRKRNLTAVASPLTADGGEGGRVGTLKAMRDSLDPRIDEYLAEAEAEDQQFQTSQRKVMRKASDKRHGPDGENAAESHASEQVQVAPMRKVVPDRQQDNDTESSTFEVLQAPRKKIMRKASEKPEQRSHEDTAAEKLDLPLSQKKIMRKVSDKRLLSEDEVALAPTEVSQPSARKQMMRKRKVSPNKHSSLEDSDAKGKVQEVEPSFEEAQGRPNAIIAESFAVSALGDMVVNPSIVRRILPKEWVKKESVVVSPRGEMALGDIG